MRLDAVAKQRPGAAAGPVCQASTGGGAGAGAGRGAAGVIRVRGCTACRGTNARSQGSNYRHRIMLQVAVLRSLPSSSSSLPLSLSLFTPLSAMLTGALLQPRPKTASFSSQAVVREQRQRRTVRPPTPPRRNTTQRNAPCHALQHLASPLIGGCLSAAHASPLPSPSPFGHFRGRALLRPIMRTQWSSIWFGQPVVRSLFGSHNAPPHTPLHCTPSHPATRATSCATWNWLLISRLCHSQLPLEGSS